MKAAVSVLLGLVAVTLNPLLRRPGEPRRRRRTSRGSSRSAESGDG